LSNLISRFAQRLAASLASSTATTDGAGRIGFAYALAYGAGTLGKWLKDLALGTGAAFIGWTSALAGAVLRTIASKLADVVSVRDFGAVGDNVADDAAAFAAALATGKDVFVPAGTYKVTSALAMSTAYQRLFGHGWASQINFDLAASGNGITTSNSTGWQAISRLYLNGVANVAKVVSVGSPDVTVECNRVNNATATGHGIYLENENGGANTFCFDARIRGNLITGVLAAGNYGIYCGLNHQGLRVEHNSIQNWGNLIYVNGATTSTVMPAYNITIEHNYFEENQVCVYVDDADIQNLSVRGNYAYRNTVAPAGAAFYKTGTNTSAASTNIRVDDNHADSFVNFFSLANEYAGNFVSAKGNTWTVTAGAYNAGTAYAIGDAVTSGGATYYCIAPTTGNAPPNATYWLQAAYSTGTWSDKAYAIRQHNAYFGSVIASGAYASQSVTRQEAATGTFRVPVRWEPHEYLDLFIVKYLRAAANPSITINLHKVSVDTDTVIATSGAVTTDINIVVPVGGFAEKNCHYYLEFVCTTSGGITAYFYPAQFYLRA